MHSYFSKSLKSCPDFSSSYGKVPALESTSPFTGGEKPLDSPFISPLPAWLLWILLSVWPIQRVFSFGGSSFTQFPNKTTTQTKKQYKNMPQDQVWGERPQSQPQTQWLYCKRLQQQRRKKTPQLAKERKRAKCPPEAECWGNSVFFVRINIPQRLFPSEVSLPTHFLFIVQGMKSF